MQQCGGRTGHGSINTWLPAQNNSPKHIRRLTLGFHLATGEKTSLAALSSVTLPPAGSKLSAHAPATVLSRLPDVKHLFSCLLHGSRAP